MLNLRDLSPRTKGKGGKYVDEQRRSPYSLLSCELGKDHLLLSTLLPNIPRLNDHLIPDYSLY